MRARERELLEALPLARPGARRLPAGAAVVTAGRSPFGSHRPTSAMILAIVVLLLLPRAPRRGRDGAQPHQQGQGRRRWPRSSRRKATAALAAARRPARAVHQPAPGHGHDPARRRRPSSPRSWPTACSGRSASSSASSSNVVVFFVLAEALPKTWAVLALRARRAADGPPDAGPRVVPAARGSSRTALIGLANVLLPGKGLKKGPFVSEEELLGDRRRRRRGRGDRARGARAHRVDHRVRRHRRPRGHGAPARHGDGAGGRDRHRGARHRHRARVLAAPGGRREHRRRRRASPTRRTSCGPSAKATAPSRGRAVVRAGRSSCPRPSRSPRSCGRCRPGKFHMAIARRRVRRHRRPGHARGLHRGARRRHRRRVRRRGRRGRAAAPTASCASTAACRIDELNELLEPDAARRATGTRSAASCSARSATSRPRARASSTTGTASPPSGCEGRRIARVRVGRPVTGSGTRRADVDDRRRSDAGVPLGLRHARRAARTSASRRCSTPSRRRR